MKFDFIVGNPPYQNETPGEQKTFQPPTYHEFIDATYEIGEAVELIHPARFLYNAGSTPKAWNRKMLQDTHLKVLQYEEDASKLFPDVEIKGGVVITYRDKSKDFKPIEVFAPYPAMDSIRRKAAPPSEEEALTSIIHTQNRFDLDILFSEHPELKAVIGANGKDRRFRNNIFEKVPLFKNHPSSESDLPVIGVVKNKRVWRFLPARFVEKEHKNLAKWKLLLPSANGSGKLGEPLAKPLIASPMQGYTQTFIGIGAFEKESEAAAVLKYVSTKFARLMLGFLKTTQHSDRNAWLMVPLQDFTDSSDVDWSKSISEIDQQLYKKYSLSHEEIDFIETHVKEMV